MKIEFPPYPIQVRKHLMVGQVDSLTRWLRKQGIPHAIQKVGDGGNARYIVWRETRSGDFREDKCIGRYQKGEWKNLWQSRAAERDTIEFIEEWRPNV